MSDAFMWAIVGDVRRRYEELSPAEQSKIELGRQAEARVKAVHPTACWVDLGYTDNNKFWIAGDGYSQPGLYDSIADAWIAADATRRESEAKETQA